MYVPFKTKMQLSSHPYLYERSSSTASSIPSTMAPNNSGSNTIHTSYFSLHFVITYFVTAAAASSITNGFIFFLLICYDLCFRLNEKTCDNAFWHTFCNCFCNYYCCWINYHVNSSLYDIKQLNLYFRLTKKPFDKFFCKICAYLIHWIFSYHINSSFLIFIWLY